jgi:hypothetical protein
VSIYVYILYIYSMPRVRIWIYFSFPRAQAQGSLITTVVRGGGRGDVQDVDDEKKVEKAGGKGTENAMTMER